MSQNEDQSAQKRRQRVFILTLAAVSGQVGCLTLIIILAALSLGLWLDSLLDSRPVFTAILMIVSIPITLVTMIFVVKKTTSRMITRSIDSRPKEGEDLGTKT
ncbi:MAG: AtpZ/AtpI family protein [Anaerolineales bacterium]|nr:AtpZ/AtpI family protein [Anaerolineales bacterium]